MTAAATITWGATTTEPLAAGGKAPRPVRSPPSRGRLPLAFAFGGDTGVVEQGTLSPPSGCPRIDRAHQARSGGATPRARPTGRVLAGRRPHPSTGGAVRTRRRTSERTRGGPGLAAGSRRPRAPPGPRGRSRSRASAWLVAACPPTGALPAAAGARRRRPFGSRLSPAHPDRRAGPAGAGDTATGRHRTPTGRCSWPLPPGSRRGGRSPEAHRHPCAHLPLPPRALSLPWRRPAGSSIRPAPTASSRTDAPGEETPTPVSHPASTPAPTTPSAMSMTPSHRAPRSVPSPTHEKERTPRERRPPPLSQTLPRPRP